ncbi:MAG TPA: sodium:calcium antiporter [Halococcus sp.]|nr:sodium:calcium antiporter [Halococcus sp.]
MTIMLGESIPLALVSGTLGNGIFLVGAFVLLLLGAEIFTNGVEWLGQHLGMGDSATGSILAAVGTALPETMIPVIAIIGAFFSGGGGESASAIGVGAILGAPFLLATIAMFLVGVSVIYFSGGREHGSELHVDDESTERDLSFFLVGYSLAFIAAFIPIRWITIVIGLFLIAWYGFYVYRTLQNDDFVETGEELDPLYLGKIAERFTGGRAETVPDGGQGYASDPPQWIVVLQTLIALAIIIGGAHLFVGEVRFFSNQVLAIPAAVLSLLLAPFATELPEKFNSVIWISDDKDTLALGNITGAMAFQGTLPVMLGILFTSWDLSLQWGPTGFLNSLSAILALVSAAILYYRARADDTGAMRPGPFLIGGAFYAVFIVVLIYHVLAFDLAVSGH